MASPQAPDKIGSNMAITAYWMDGSYSTATDIDEWVDMRDYEGIMMLGISGNLTGSGVEQLSIIADAESDGSGGNVTIEASSDTAATAEGDYVTVECTSEQIRQEGEDNTKELRYVSCLLENNNDGDETIVVYIRWPARFPRDGLTAGVST